MDSPLIDIDREATWRIIRQAQRRGYITSEEFGRLLPLRGATLKHVEDVIGQLAQAGIDLVGPEEGPFNPLAPAANSNEPLDWV